MSACTSREFVSGDSNIGLGENGAAKLYAERWQHNFTDNTSDNFPVKFSLHVAAVRGGESVFYGEIPVIPIDKLYVLRLSQNNADGVNEFVDLGVRRGVTSFRITDGGYGQFDSTSSELLSKFSIALPVEAYQKIIQKYGASSIRLRFHVVRNNKGTAEYFEVNFKKPRLGLVHTGTVKSATPWSATLTAVDFAYNSFDTGNPTGVTWRLSKQGSAAAVFSGSWSCQADGTQCSNAPGPIQLSTDRKIVTIQSDALIESGTSYTLTATVSSSEPGSSTYTTSATIVPKDQDPIASIRRVSPDSTIVFGQPVQFDASDSVVPKGSTVVFKYTTLDDVSNPVNFPPTGGVNGAVDLRPSLSFSKKIDAVYVVISPPNGGTPKSQKVDLSSATYAIALPTGGF